MAAAPGSRRLYVHVGLQKTGTSYLQAALLASREELAAHGVDLVPATKGGSYRLMLAVRRMYAAERTEEQDAARLQHFADALAAAPGDTAVYSQESLAGASAESIDRFLAACGDREVHVVLTARDLARQLPSSWQEILKYGRAIAYLAYLDRLRSMEQARLDRPPWVNLDPAMVLARWSAPLPPERVHVVTVPPSGSPSGLLLARFCSVLGVDPGWLRPEERPSNRSLGRVEAELLRRVNAQLPDDLRRRQVYGRIGKRFFAAQVLRQQESRRILVPAAFRPWCEEVTDRTVDAIRAAGYDVVGDLADLWCPDAAFTDDDADPTEDEVASAAVTAIVGLLTERAEADAEAEAAAARQAAAAATPPAARRRRRELIPVPVRRGLGALAGRRPRTPAPGPAETASSLRRSG
jgi:hypothetical protein